LSIDLLLDVKKGLCFTQDTVIVHV